MTEIINRYTLCGKVLKTKTEEACEGGECEGEYEFHNNSDLVFNFCKGCRKILEEKDKEYNAWKIKHNYTAKSGQL